MSRIGKKPIEIPTGTEVKVADGFVVVKGPLGELSQVLHESISMEVKDGKIITAPKDENIATQALWGTMSSLIRNMIEGVNTLFEKKLILEGVGYRVEVVGDKLVLTVGFSHTIDIPIPEGLNVTAEKNVILVTGISKHKVGQFAAVVRSHKKPEPYKGKGIRYEDEVIRRKEGKKAV